MELGNLFMTSKDVIFSGFNGKRILQFVII